jgi:uncharacterized protein with PQ loop repeat
MTLQHLHARKRGGKDLEPYPARTRWKRSLDRVIYAVGVIGPVMTLPQIVLIYAGRNATGVSALSFFAMALLDIPWILYGAVHGERPIMMTYTLWLLCNFAIAAGALMYGGSLGF